MADLVLKNVNKVYPNGFAAVKDMNLEIGNKDFVTLVGPSGCGKSTALRMMAGLEEITSGELLIEGEVANEWTPKDRNMAMLFPNYALYRQKTVYENLALGLEIRGMAREEIEERIQRTAALLNLENLLPQKVKTLLEEARSRVAMGRAIIFEPRMLLMDNPFADMAPKLRRQKHTEISKLHKILGLTVIYAVQDLTEAMTMGGRVVVMNGGAVEKVIR